MSATLIHHGHIRLLKQAAEHGKVIVGLTTDEEVLSKKGYQVELAFTHRKEVLEAIQYVDEVVGVPWQITEDTLDEFKIDLLVHGDDNCNNIIQDRLLILPRTEGVSSTEIRSNAQRAITQKNNHKLMLTPGPAAVPHENLQNLKPLFGRGDDEYTAMAESVINWVKKLSGQDEVITMQGSATFALELAAHSFVSGKVLLVSTGYYSDRLEKLLPNGCELTICKYEELDGITDNFDWVLCAYTETSVAFKVDLQSIKNKADDCGAKLYVDATGSIGLEGNHSLADVMAFSSCKGLFGLTGAGFVAHSSDLIPKTLDTFYFNLETQKNKMTTGPYHAIASLYGVIDKHDIFKQRVINSKNAVLEKYQDIVRSDNQPLLCTYLEGEVVPNDNDIVLYSPRSELSGSVICHFGEIDTDGVNINNRISVK
ncbi:MAG: 2-aminoethylphosphonate--pyruvate transaminase [Catillopecten margaritatus gill symbiont]|uniref:ethanolamine-phosphate cytidylyltransferase n=1 Tax=Catillopecten margaritatus gill symbiont TaxID=3083288 RepID=A0AAU6PG29_9GAMM